MPVSGLKNSGTKEGNDDYDSPKRSAQPIAASSPLPDHLRKIVTNARHDNDNNYDNHNNGDVFRCRYCFKYYDCVSRWKPPMRNAYFLQCRRHRKSYLYWCKYHQVGFRTKALFIEHCCNCNVGANSTDGNSNNRRTRTSNISESCGGMPCSHSWTYTYNPSDDGVDVDRHKMGTNKKSSYQWQRHFAGSYNQTRDILNNKLISWTYALDNDNDDNASKPAAPPRRHRNHN
uniref:Uncharacterized protein n=1 Tax=Pseudo-nitzschia australis TaxID=44445 RepID=A0A7S4EE56_9STRA|mmetsp:Transcript_1032/g.2395  ORF Transcript_1032/g.2395 Transcript_1032/m.2395 type:complete len:231 (+) Transcript_1032:285-977(+)